MFKEVYWSWIKCQVGSLMERGSNQTKAHKDNGEDAPQETKGDPRAVISKITCIFGLRPGRNKKSNTK